MHQGMTDEEGRQQGEDDDEGIEHDQTARLLEIVCTIEAEVHREAYHEDGHVDDLSQQRYPVFRTHIATFVLTLVRLDDAIGLVSDNLTTVDDLLTFINHAHGQRYTRHQLVLAGLAALTVEDEVGHDIVVQVALLQQGLLR